MNHSLGLKVTVLVVLPFLWACGPDGQLQGERSLDSELAQTSAGLSVSTYTYTLPARGGTGGNPNTLSCLSGYVAAGIYGRSGIFIDQLGLECAYLNADGSLGYRYRTLAVGGPGGDSFSFSCPANQAIVGFRGGGAQYVDGLGIYCANAATWRANGIVQYVSSQAGGNGGNIFNDLCPSAYMVSALQLRGGSLVDQEKSVCSYIYP